MSEDQFTKLFKYMERRFDLLDRNMEEKASRAQVEKIQNAVDKIHGMLETEQQERLAINQKLDRHESWITQIATKTDTKLSY